MEPRASINGQRSALDQAHVAVTDEGFARGDGAFETIGVWQGRAFRLDDHLARLVVSLRAAGLEEPDAGQLRTEIDRVLDGASEDAALRIYVTASGTRVLTLGPQPSGRGVAHLAVHPAPWIRPLGTYGPAGAKTMSYLPNMAATRAAQRRGADDALLVALEGWVLEGPTFAILWVADGRLYAPPVSLGIVDSVTRRTLLELSDDEVIQEPRPLDHLLDAQEVLACSAIRGVVAVRRVGDQAFDAATPVCDRLAAALQQRRRA
ncbi:MAG: aminotransferase class IV [Actinomycetota bacterium]|nr:aminotransferase class IV [Euzebyaceae bacterium]MDQ3452544.1 aminotransferase class IV [Actinomycetota bacterium]